MTGELGLLNRALINYAIDFMSHKGFTYIETPLMVKADILSGVCSHEDIEGMAYKIENEELYLIATSEHPIIGKFKDNLLDVKKLPIKLFCFSPCFRKEVGSHGIDEKGLYRTHQFNKVEMIILCKEKDADKHYKEMAKLSREIYKNLGIPIRMMDWCSGELGVLRKKAIEFEFWSPRKKEYSEIGSLSDSGATQARRLNIRYLDGKDKHFVNTLNNTVIATSRALVALIENNQTKEGEISIPRALQQYMNGKRCIKHG